MINKENDKNTTIKRVMTIYGLRKRMQWNMKGWNYKKIIINKSIKHINRAITSR
jgi:hypothetical protein